MQGCNYKLYKILARKRPKITWMFKHMHSCTPISKSNGVISHLNHQPVGSVVSKSHLQFLVIANNVCKYQISLNMSQ